MRTEEQWIEEYKRKDALWIHDGNPKRPHVLLTSGLHSHGFFNSELVMEDPYLLNKASEELTVLLWRENKDVVREVNRVVGPAMGAITFAHDLARQITIEQDSGKSCLRAYIEKEDGKMVFKRTKIRPGEKVILAEDVLTTGGSLTLTADAVIKAQGVILPFIIVLVNRSGLKELDGCKTISLIDKPMINWTPEHCLFCKEGSEAIRPKGKEEWGRLNADY